MSGIYIPGMEMPKRGNGFDITIYPDGSCISENGLHYTLVPVPDHGRLGDLDAVERHLVKMQMAQKDVVAHGIRKARAVVRDMPTIIPAEEESLP